ncbi:MAG: hypothetical protein ACYCV5_07195 [Acidimicrobiales bacterium]
MSEREGVSEVVEAVEMVEVVEIPSVAQHGAVLEPLGDPERSVGS